MTTLDTPQTRSIRPASVILGCLACCVLWLKVGLVPTSSTSDELWAADTAYTLITEGSFRTPMLDDDLGRGVREMGCPPWILGEAVFFKIFGLTPFGMSGQCAMLGTIGMILIAMLVHVMGGSVVRSSLASVAIWGSPVLARGLAIGRPEPWLALCTLVSALCFVSIRKESRWCLISAGIALGIGCISYYPQAPMFLAAWLAGFLIAHGISRRAIGWCCLGLALVAIPALSWYLPNLDLFRAQVTSVGAAHYFSWANLLAPLISTAQVSPSEAWAQHAEMFIAFCASIGLLLRSKTPTVRIIAAMAALSSIPMFVYAIPRQTVPSLLVVSLLFTGRLRIPFRAFICAGLLLMAIARLGLEGATAVLQYDARDYRPIAEALRSTVVQPGPVAIGKRAWLGLRNVVPLQDMDFLVFTPTSLPNMPKRAKREDADSLYRYVIIERDMQTPYFNVYPWLKRGIDAGRFKLVREIQSALRPLPWDRQRSFDLLVFEQMR